MRSNTLIGCMDFRDYVLEKVLEETGMVREMYLSLHEGDESIKESDIEWFRKVYSLREAPCYSFTFIARGEYFVHFVKHGFDDSIDFSILEDYARENYHGYVDEFYHGDESLAPTFKCGVLVFAPKEQE